MEPHSMQVIGAAFTPASATHLLGACWLLDSYRDNAVLVLALLNLQTHLGSFAGGAGVAVLDSGLHDRHAAVLLACVSL